MIYLFLFIAVVVIGTVIKVKADSGGTASNARIRGYKVVVDGDQVKSGGRVIGPLAGARAEITDPTSRHTITRIVTVAGAMTKKTKAVVVVTCANGAYRQSVVDGAASVRRAQAWVIRFNAIAAARPAPAEPAPAPSTHDAGSVVVASPAREFGPDYAPKEDRLDQWRAEHPPHHQQGE